MQGGGSVVRQNGHLALRDDFAAIHPGIDIVDGTAGDRFAGGQRLHPRFASRKFWEQRRMQIDDAARKRIQYRRLQHAHEAGQHDQLHPGGAQQPNEFFLHFRLQSCPESCRAGERSREPRIPARSRGCRHPLRPKQQFGSRPPDSRRGFARGSRGSSSLFLNRVSREQDDALCAYRCIRSIKLEVDFPGTKGRVLISAPASWRAATSSGSRLSSV